MLDCLILGDSIAVGTHKARPECVAYAKGGINSWQFNKQYPGEFFSNSVIISLGSNDHKHIKTRSELEALRKRITVKDKVFWILPAGNLKASGVKIEDINSIVIDIAKKNGDWVVSPHPQYMSKDGIHPTGTGYEWLAFFTRGHSNDKEQK